MTRKAIRDAAASLYFGLAMLFVALGSPLAAPAQQQKQSDADWNHLVQIVRNATRQYQNVANAGPDYGPVLGCVSGSDHGAMGIHYVNGKFHGETLLAGGQLDPTKPQALIYEPQANGELKLVGVEFIIFASVVPPGPAPQVDGHLMLYIDGPGASRPDAPLNRYGLPAFYELHVWAWKDNPQGSFVDWNDHVTCAHQQ